MLSLSQNAIRESRRLDFKIIVMVFLKLIALCLIASIAKAQKTKQCGDNYREVLNRDKELSDSFSYLFYHFNQTCWTEGTCSSSYSETKSTITRDYESFTGINYRMLKRSCERQGSHHKLCSIDSKQRRGDHYIVEKNKAVCFPGSCSADFAYMVDPSLLSCSGDPECSVMSSQVDCDGGFSSPINTDECEDEMDELLDSDSYTRLQEKILNAMMRSCLQVLLGGSEGEEDNSCSIDATSTTTAQLDFSQYKNHESYKRYKNTCLQENKSNAFCDVTYYSSTVADAGFLTLEIDNDYTDYPICIPMGCKDLPAEQLATSLFINDGVVDKSTMAVSSFSCVT